MDDGNQKIEINAVIKKEQEKEEVFSKVLRAGKRTYFFDVKKSRSDDFYITITESMKRINRDGRFFYEKHKIFLYREDFEGFVDGLSAILEFVEAQPENKSLIRHSRHSQTEESKTSINEELEEVLEESYSSLNFEDLEEKH
jgi:hypothetical protein